MDKGNTNMDLKNIIAKSTCQIECLIEDEKIVGAGFLVTLPIPDKKNPIRGLITINDFIDDKIIYNAKITLNFLLEEKTINFNPQDYFCFSDAFINIFFIELKNPEFNEFEFIYLEENDNNLNNVYIIKDLKSKILSKGIIATRWGYKLLHTISNEQSLQGSPIVSLDNNRIIGIHTNKQIEGEHGGVFCEGINMKAAIQAIRVLYKSYISDKFAFIQKNNIFSQKELKLLTDSEINELKEHGLISTAIPELFISPRSLYVTPLWFYRTNYAWYWTPKEPVNDNIEKPNWIIIYPECSLKVIGGYWDGQEPAQRNINLIHWLESTGLDYLV